MSRTSQDDVDDDSTASGRVRRLWAGVRAESVAYYRLTRSEIKNNKVGYALGFLACLVVVVVVGISSSVLTRFPLMFAKLGELDNGAADVVFRPDNYGDYLDYRRFERLFKGSLSGWDAAGERVDLEAMPSFQLSTPRIMLTNGVQAAALSQCSGAPSPSSDWRWLYLGANNTLDTQQRCGAATTNRSAAALGTRCLRRMCSSALQSATLYVQDMPREFAMDYGGDDGDADSIGTGSCQVSSRFAKQTGVRVGDVLLLTFDLRQHLPGLWPALFDPRGGDGGDGDVWSNPVLLSPPGGNSTDSDADAGQQGRIGDKVVLHLTVAGQYPFLDNRKYAKRRAPDVRVDYASFFRLLAEQLDPIVAASNGSDAAAALNATDPYHYAHTITVNFPRPRLDHYASPDMDEVHRRVLAFASPLAHRLQLRSVSIETPIFDDIWSTLRWMSLFLGLIMNLIIFVLLLLSVILIYSLLMISVENRTFQVGILRMVGMRRRQLVQFLVFQALSFSVPSIVIGVPLAQLISLVISALFQRIAEIKLDVSVTFGSTGSAVALGLLVPVVSSLLPIRRALAHNLHEAIDVRRAGPAAVQVVLERARDDRVSPGMLVASGLLLSFGFAIYYLFPLSLVSGNLSLLLNIFFALLLMMLFGLVLLSINFQHWLERLCIGVGFAWERPTVRHILHKNLVAHRRRNRLTTVLYAISLAFIVFLLVSYDVQIQSLLIQRNQRHGTLVNVQTSPYFTADELRAYENFATASSAVRGYAWISGHLDEHVAGLSYQGLSNVGRIYRYPTSVRTCSASFFDVTLPGFLVVDSWNHRLLNGDLLAQLYAPSADMPILVGTSFKDSLHLALDGRVLFQRDVAGRGSSLFVSRVSAFLDSAPFFSFSQYSIMQSRQDTLVSAVAFRRLANLSSVDDIRYTTLLLQVPDDLSRDAWSDLLQQIKDVSPRASVWEYRSGLDTIRTANIVVSLFFGTAIAVAMVISCFSLTSSMMTNIWEQAKEIGVLRALGIPESWIVRLYIYESFIVVFTSSTLGIIIGTFVGWTMSLQRVLFTNLPTPFTFPWLPMVVTIMFSFVFAFVSSYSPVKNLLRQTIVQNMRLLT